MGHFSLVLVLAMAPPRHGRTRRLTRRRKRPPRKKRLPRRPRATPKPKYPPYADVLKDVKSDRRPDQAAPQGNQVYAELTSSQLNRDFIVLISIARGIGEGQLAGRHELGLRRRLAVAVPQGRRQHPRRAPQRALHGRQRQPRREGRQAGLHRQRAVQPADRHDRPHGRIGRRPDAGLHERPAANLARRCRASRSRRTNRPGPRSRASPTTSSWKSPPPMPRAARSTSTPCPTAAARRSTSTTRSACCRRPAISRAWPTIASATS